MVDLENDLVYFFIMHVIELLEILVIVHEDVGQRLLLTQYYVVIEFYELLKHQIEAEVDLLLLYVVIYG